MTTWQLVHGKKIPFEFTVQANKGLHYWDGFIFDFNGEAAGEACIFEETDLLFASAIVRLRQPPS